MAVRSKPSRVSPRGEQQRFNAWGAFLTAHVALEPILNRELEDGIRRHFAAYITDNEAGAVEAALGRIAAAARQDDSLASQPTSTGT